MIACMSGRISNLHWDVDESVSFVSKSERFRLCGEKQDLQSNWRPCCFFDWILTS